MAITQTAMNMRAAASAATAAHPATVDPTRLAVSSATLSGSRASDLAESFARHLAAFGRVGAFRRVRRCAAVTLGRKALTGPWTRLFERVQDDPEVTLVVNECDLPTGRVQQVTARGRAELVPFDVPRGRRKLSRYLGEDEALWDDRFVRYLYDDPGERGTVWLRLRPVSLSGQDLSYAAVPS